jgi:ATP-dependent Lon protease
MGKTSQNIITNKKNLKKGKSDPDSESSSSEEEEWETESSSSESESSESLKKVRRSKRNKKCVVESSESDEDDDESGESDSDESYHTDDELDEEEMTPKQYKKFLADLFPSKYSKKRAEEEESEEDSRPTKESKKSKKSKNKKEVEETKKSKKSAKKLSSKKKSKKIESDEESDSSSDDSESESDSSKSSEQKINIVLSLEQEYEDYFGNESEEDEDEDEECNSDDEQKFMKEKYEKVDIPKTEEEIKQIEKEKKKKEKKSKKESKHDEKSGLVESNLVESEYMELLELKKDLGKKLLKNPKSKILKKAVTSCTESIRKLIKNARKQNVREYRKLINVEMKKPNEMTYFKKQLSNVEQLKIMKDLKEINEFINIDKPYRLALLESKIPPKIKAHAFQKLNMLNSMDNCDPEYYKIKNWVDTFMRIPFCIYKSLSVNMNDGIDVCHSFMTNAKRSLDDCVYGLDDAKLQIMQMIGQWITNPDAMGTSIAIKGPPGTGKTTLVKDGISKILGREFVFIPLGGTGDASYLEGHSYTYEGSTWGKIVQSLINCKCMNPVFYFDELDKLSDTAKGQEITGILTHLTDTTQNAQFHDKYFSDIDFDLSKCLFIFSYNDESHVNPILKDRMYRIQTKGYDSKEKIVIARNYLLPKIREQVNFKEDEIIIPDETIQYIITSEEFTQGESGVRNLKRCLEIVHTKLNLFRLMKPEENIFEKDMKLEVTFPFTVLKKHIDVFIKNEGLSSRSVLSSMYV